VIMCTLIIYVMISWLRSSHSLTSNEQT